MSSASPPDALRFSLPNLEGRRSTRIDRTVPLVVLGQTRSGLSFQEKTATVSFNLHGCRYPTRHEYAVGMPVGLRVMQSDGETISPVIRAFVKSVHPPANSRELFQVGVELECPANIWNLSPAPADWNRLTGGHISSTGLATAVAPAVESPSGPTVVPPPPVASDALGKASPLMPFPAPVAGPTAAETEAAKDPATLKAERVAITIDQLVSAMQGKLQLAAEKVVQNAFALHLEEAIQNALLRIDEVRESHSQRMEQFSLERFESMLRSSREEILGHLESRLGEVQSQWEEQHAAFRNQAEEISKRLELQAAETERKLTETQKFTQKVALDIQPRTLSRLDESVGEVTEKFEANADRISDRQLVRVMEATRMVTREAAAQLDARVAESRALMQSASNHTLEEFRRQAEVQVDLAVTETMERVKSALGALDADNRTVCEERRRTLVEEVARATENSTEQFRSGMKAFLYSCLVAAVGAVDEHAKTTLDSMVKSPGKATPAIPDLTPAPPDDEKPN